MTPEEKKEFDAMRAELTKLHSEHAALITREAELRVACSAILKSVHWHEKHTVKRGIMLEGTYLGYTFTGN